MFRRILTTALLAGFLGGACISVIQEFTTTPIILHAEQFEAGGGTHHHGAAANTGSFTHTVRAECRPPGGRCIEARQLHHRAATSFDTRPLRGRTQDERIGEPLPRLTGLTFAQAGGGGAAPQQQEEGWAPADGLERTLFTAMANIIAGVGFSLILVGCFALSGEAVDGRRGVLWGIGGFAVMSLAPSLGLPPEVPGAMTAELGARQGWWLLCVAATGIGLWMLVFRAGALWIAAGIALLVAPHLIGAPQPALIGGPVPPELAGHFAAASLVTAAVFWCLLGWLSGTVWRRSEGGA